MTPNHLFDELIETLGILCRAIDAHDKDEAFEGVTIFLLQYLQVFGHDEKFMRRTYPTLEELKEHIVAERYDDAMPIVLAFLAKFRGAAGVE